MFLSSLGVGFDLVITPLFWYELAPILFTLDWKGLNIITNVHLITLHTLPVIGTLLNVYYTKGFVMLPRDAVSMLLLGLIYIPCNYYGYIYEGHSLYPVADWKDTKKTIEWYVLLAIVEAVCFFGFAHFLCWSRGKKPIHA